MRSSRKSKTEGSSEKVFRASFRDLAITFALKTLIPLIPIAAVIYVAGLIMNSEVTGNYEGLCPGVGAMNLSLTEDNERLSGKLLLRRHERYLIVDGKMLDDNSMEIHLRKELPGQIEITDPTASQDKSGNGGQLPDEASSTAEVSSPEIKLEGKKDQNEIRGKLEINGNAADFTVSRSTFAAFFGKRWINRSLNYLGFKIKL